MASGDTLLILRAQDGVPPATAYATFDTRAGGSTPAEAVPVLDFDDGTDEFIDFYCELPLHYDGGGLTVTLKWMATSATTNAVVWGAAIRRIADDAEDIDGAHTYAYNTVTATTASATGEYDYADITFASGTDMDDLAAGEAFILRISRDADNGSDNLSGDAELASLAIKET